MNSTRFNKCIVLANFALVFTFFAPRAHAQSRPISAEAQRVFDHWTKERIQGAIPRDFVVDERGLGYLHKPDGRLQPYGHDVPAKVALGKPVGGGDTTPPDISNIIPDGTADVGSSQLFSATVIDQSGVKSVSFIITDPNGSTQSFTPAYMGDNLWQITLQGFSDGSWSWQVVAIDRAPKGGNSAQSDPISFEVNTGSGGGSYIITSAEWSRAGVIQNAAGRLYFEMPPNKKRRGPWLGYVCSGTVVRDSANNDRSIIMTASHCVYDDANKAFARNVLFIPDQAETTGSGTDLNCSNDRFGCWVPSFGVVDVNWTTRTFPNNVAWDYAYYVVSNSGAHQGTSTSSEVLETAVGSLVVSFEAVAYDSEPASATSDDFTYALGYSYSADPNFMYCSENMTTNGAVNWWLPSCALTGGSSGGPWVQPMDTGSGTGPIISVNSWGYTNQPGMAGPMLVGTSASDIFSAAESINLSAVPIADGDAGVAVTP